jgi:Replication-relaxation
VAAERGVEPKTLWRQDRSLILARSRTLARLVGINGLFTALMGAERRGEGRLVEWWSAGRCADWCGDLVTPDGFGAWEDGSGVRPFFVEWDRWEPATTWAPRLARHADLADALGRHVDVLVVACSRRREVEIRRGLDGLGATTVTAVASDPAFVGGAAWLPAALEIRHELLAWPPSAGRPLPRFARRDGARPEWAYRESAPGTLSLAGTC